MKNYTKAALSMGFVAATLQLTAYADHGRDDWNHHGGRNHYAALKVALWGDEFYNADPDEKASMIDQTI